MNDSDKTPLLFTYLFGDHAGAARLSASERLLRWSKAFDDWHAEKEQVCSSKTLNQIGQAWKRLLEHLRKPPWAISQDGIEAHVTWLKTKYKATTINKDISYISQFYRWCSGREIDPDCEPGFNPAGRTPRLPVQRYAHAEALSRGEVEALLNFMRRDKTALGRRDYAFILARLQLGVPLAALRNLAWEQIELDGSGAWVRWKPEAGRKRLPEKAWKAMVGYLKASGRLTGLLAIGEAGADSSVKSSVTDESSKQVGRQHFIFCPLADYSREDAGDEPGDWDDSRPLTVVSIESAFKVYGQRVGIPKNRLTLHTLRHTATALHLEAGATPEEIQDFLQCKSPLPSVKFDLKFLPRISGDGSIEPAGNARFPGAATEHAPDSSNSPLPELPNRKGDRFEPWHGMTHGFFAKRQPPEEVAEVLAESEAGLPEGESPLKNEVAGLNTLLRRLMEMQAQTEDDRVLSRLMKTAADAAARVTQLAESGQGFSQASKEEKWADEYLDMLVRLSDEQGFGDTRESLEAGLQEELAQEFHREGSAAVNLEERIASIRVVIRRSFSVAMTTDEPGTLARNVEVYMQACGRLRELLKTEKRKQSDKARVLKADIQRAIEELTEEWNLRSLLE